LISSSLKGLNWRANHYGVLCVKLVHSSAAVTQRLLSEALGITARLCPLRPGVPIAVQAHACNSRYLAPSAKFCGPVIRGNAFDAWKQITGERERFEQSAKLRADR